ncbi:MAG: RNA polymerase sigma factor [Chthonomonadales bacterium]
MESTPEKILLLKAREGNADAFATLCNSYRQRVWRIAASVAKGPDADDLAQEAVLKAWCSLRTFRGDASFEAWLCKITVNLAHDYRRSAWKRKVIFWDQESDIPEQVSESLYDEVTRRETQRLVRQAVASLPDKHRTPIWLHFFEGFAIAEIARLEKISESTLRSRVQSGMKRLAVSLQDISAQDEDVKANIRLPGSVVL